MPKDMHTESAPDRFTVAVVGAGPAGLAAAAELLRSGERVVVLERGEIGAAWAGRYDRLRLHTVRWLSSLPGYRMPRSDGEWSSRDSVRDYLRRYADRSGITVRAGVAVEQIVRGDGRWLLRTREGTLEADRVIVATGHSNEPYLPEWPGTFGGELIHSARTGTGGRTPASACSSWAPETRPLHRRPRRRWSGRGLPRRPDAAHRSP